MCTGSSGPLAATEWEPYAAAELILIDAANHARAEVCRGKYMYDWRHQDIKGRRVVSPSLAPPLPPVSASAGMTANAVQSTATAHSMNVCILPRGESPPLHTEHALAQQNKSFKAFS